MKLCHSPTFECKVLLHMLVIWSLINIAYNFWMEINWYSKVRMVMKKCSKNVGDKYKISMCNKIVCFQSYIKICDIWYSFLPPLMFSHTLNFNHSYEKLSVLFVFQIWHVYHQNDYVQEKRRKTKHELWWTKWQVFNPIKQILLILYTKDQNLSRNLKYVICLHNINISTKV